MVKLYEGLMEKLTEQNNKLKLMLKTKSSKRKHLKEANNGEKKKHMNLCNLNLDKSMFDRLSHSPERISHGGNKSARSVRSDNQRTQNSQRDSKRSITVSSRKQGFRNRINERPKSSLIANQIGQKRDSSLQKISAPRQSSIGNMSKLSHRYSG